MGAMAPMKRLFGRGMRPRFAVYWANRDDFNHPGVHVWAFGRHWRVLPLPQSRRNPARKAG